MSRNPYRLAYTALKDDSCSNCGHDFDFNRLQLQQESNTEYWSLYDCDCGLETRLEVNLEGDRVVILHRIEGDIENERIIPLTKVQQLGNEVEEELDSLYQFSSLAKYLEYNRERVEHWQDKTPKRMAAGFGLTVDEFMESIDEDQYFNIEKVDDFPHLEVDIHNYLASVYTFDQFIESIKHKVTWTSEVESRFQTYNENIRAIMGLRHYSQHQTILPLTLRFREEDGEYISDYLVAVDDVDVMPAEVTEKRPDGYKYGAKHHYGHVEGEFINILDEILNHESASLKLAIALLEQSRDANREDIDDYESFNGHFSFDEVPDSSYFE